MAKNKTRIDVITVFDGELDATDVFVSLIAQKHSQKSSEESGKNNLAKTQGSGNRRSVWIVRVKRL